MDSKRKKKGSKKWGKHDMKSVEDLLNNNNASSVQTQTQYFDVIDKSLNNQDE